MKKWQVILISVLSLILVLITPMSALAQSDEPSTNSADVKINGSLAIIAPWVGWVHKELTMTVFVRYNQEALPGATIWAFTKEQAEAIKQEMATITREDAQSAVERDYEAILGAHGGPIGRTNGNGKLAYTFKQAGTYILVAAKRGYMPGFTHISIRDGIKALGIQAPKRAPVGEKVTISVFERLTQKKVEGAGVWAVSKDDIATLKEKAQALKEDASVANEDKDYESLLKDYLFLGRTDENGNLDHTFNNAAIYLLVTIKKGYFPGFAPLAIVEQPKALAIKVTPPQAFVGKEVTIHVADRQSNDKIEGASVWALSRDKIEGIKEQIAALRKNNDVPAAEKDYEAVIAGVGAQPLGKTDSNGKLTATFNSAGGYLLITLKKGYIPGYTGLAVREQPKPKPETTVTGKPRLQPASNKIV